MVNTGEVATIDLTVDNLKGEEEKIDNLANDETLINKAPMQDKKKRPKGGRLVFTKPPDDWASAKTWEFVQIQSLINLFTTTYGVKVKTMQAPKRNEFAIKCCELHAFFRKGEVKNKAHMDDNIGQWLPALLQP